MEDGSFVSFHFVVDLLMVPILVVRCAEVVVVIMVYYGIVHLISFPEKHRNPIVGVLLANR
jgi:hypothetical protein